MTTTTTRWWWVRHAPVDSGGVIYGQQDLPADVSHAPTYDALAQLLPEPAVWITSQLQRTRQTAEAILAARADAAPVALSAEPELAEQHFGDWQGRAREAVVAEAGQAWNRFWLAPAETAPPGGESFVDLLARVRRAVDRLSEIHAGQDIVAVAHGGTIRAALAIALELPAERALSFVIDNCTVTRLDRIRPTAAPSESAWRVVTVNHTPRSMA